MTTIAATLTAQMIAIFSSFQRFFLSPKPSGKHRSTDKGEWYRRQRHIFFLITEVCISKSQNPSFRNAQSLLWSSWFICFDFLSPYLVIYFTRFVRNHFPPFFTVNLSSFSSSRISLPQRRFRPWPSYTVRLQPRNTGYPYPVTYGGQFCKLYGHFPRTPTQRA